MVDVDSCQIEHMLDLEAARRKQKLVVESCQTERKVHSDFFDCKTHGKWKYGKAEERTK